MSESWNPGSSRGPGFLGRNRLPREAEPGEAEDLHLLGAIAHTARPGCGQGRARCVSSADCHVSTLHVLGGVPCVRAAACSAVHPGTPRVRAAACSGEPSVSGRGLLAGAPGHAACPGGPRRLSRAHLSMTPAQVRCSHRRHKGVPASAPTPRSCLS